LKPFKTPNGSLDVLVVLLIVLMNDLLNEKRLVKKQTNPRAVKHLSSGKYIIFSEKQ
jgi:hypothetical protein